MPSRSAAASSGPRNLNAQVPSLESDQFVPSSRPGTALDKFSQQLVEQYQAVCARALLALLKRAGKSAGRTLEGLAAQASEATYQKYLEAPTEEMRLLGVLKQLAEDEKIGAGQLEAALKQRLASESVLERDLLANVYTREHFLRPYVDLVLENLASSSKLKVLEVNSTTSTVSGAISEFLSTLNGIQEVDYTLAHPRAKSLPDDVLQAASQVKLVDWNMSKSTIPGEVNNCDLIVYKSAAANSNGDSSEPRLDHSSLLASIHDNIRPN